MGASSLNPGAVSATRASKSKHAAEVRDATGQGSSSAPASARAEASAPASAVACEHSAGIALSTCLLCLVTSDIKHWIARFTALRLGVAHAPLASWSAPPRGSAKPGFWKNVGARSRIFTSTSSQCRRDGTSALGMYAAIVWWKHFSNTSSNASFSCRFRKDFSGDDDAPCVSCVLDASVPAASAAASRSAPPARTPSMPRSGSSSALTIASSSGGAASFASPGFWKYLYGLSSVCTATSAFAVRTRDCSLPTIRLDSCIAPHSAGSRSGHRLARVTSSVTTMRKVSARSRTTGPEGGATSRD